MGIVDYLIRNSLIKSVAFIIIFLLIIIAIYINIEELYRIQQFSSISEYFKSNSIENSFNILLDALNFGFKNKYLFYIFWGGLFAINFHTIAKTIIFYKEINMPYALGFHNVIKKFEWQNKNQKISHDKFIRYTDNSLLFKNSISIDLEKYEKFKNEIIQFLNLPDNHEIKILPYGRKGVEIRFFILPTNFQFTDSNYKKGYINIGMSANGIYYIDILQLTHMIVAGESGSGKSNFMHHILKSIFINSDHIESLTLIDLKGTELYPYKDLKNVTFIDKIEEVKETMQNLKDEMNQRFEKMKKSNSQIYNGKFKIVIIDEVGTIGTSDKKIKDFIFNLMTEIAQKGRAAKVLLLIFSQKLDSTNLASNVLTNLQSKVLMRTDSDFNINNTIGKKEDIEKITRLDPSYFPKGRLIIKDAHDSSKHLIQVPFVDLNKATYLEQR